MVADHAGHLGHMLYFLACAINHGFNIEYDTIVEFNAVLR